jgi:Zn-dependent alcohol dehydrogenase
MRDVRNGVPQGKAGHRVSGKEERTMDSKLNRREFLKISSATTLGAGAMTGAFTLGAAEEAAKPLRVGMIGVGGRGTAHVQSLLAMGVQIPAICDITQEHLERAQSLVEKAGQKRPEGYGRDTEDYQRMMTRDDLDAVLIATYWEYHAPIALCAMKSGKYAAVEVPVALTIEECWDLVNTTGSSTRRAICAGAESFW